MVAPVIIAAGIGAASSLAGQMLQARQQKKRQREQMQFEKGQNVAQMQFQSGQEPAKAIAGIIDSMRSTLIKRRG